jgi:hypothetical protein
MFVLLLRKAETTFFTIPLIPLLDPMSTTTVSFEDTMHLSTFSLLYLFVGGMRDGGGKTARETYIVAHYAFIGSIQLFQSQSHHLGAYVAISAASPPSLVSHLLADTSPLHRTSRTHTVSFVVVPPSRMTLAGDTVDPPRPPTLCRVPRIARSTGSLHERKREMGLAVRVSGTP